VVLPSIFEEQIEREQEMFDALMTTGIDSFSEALTYFPSPNAYSISSENYINMVRAAAQAVNIPVIASLNGITEYGWIDYAQQIEEAGASAIELNIYFIPSDPTLSGADVEMRYIDIVKSVRSSVKIPIAVKIGPYFSSPGHMANRLDQAGANGLVLFNRFYQPDIDLARLALTFELQLSSAYEMRLSLLWIGVLAGRIKASLAATTGVSTGDDIVKYLLAGADVVMTTSALLKHGLPHIKVLLNELEKWLEVRGLDSADRIRGRMSLRAMPDATAYHRANYIKTLQRYSAN
jgi:dihydroorotate dehydrogenase (fumarate)